MDDTQNRLFRRQIETAEKTSFFTLTKPFFIGMSTSMVACALFLTFNFIAMSVPTDKIQKALRADFSSHPEVFENGDSSFNDCLLTAMTIDRPADKLRAAISPNRIYGIGDGSQDICGGLRDLAYNGTVNPATHISVPYHQYWSGMRAVLALSLPIVGVGGVRNTLQAVWVLSFAIAVIVTAKRLFAKPGQSFDRSKSILVILICLAVFSQVPEKSKAFDAAPTDILFLWTLIIIAIGKTKWNTGWKFYAGLGLIGALVGYFEMLHGAIPIYFASIFFLMGWPFEKSDSFLMMMWQSLLPAGVFLIGVATAFCVKIILVMIFIDPYFSHKFFDLLQYRMLGNAPEQDVAALSGRFPNDPVSILTVGNIFYRGAWRIAWGYRTIGVIAMTATGIIHAVGIAAMLTTKDFFTRRRLQRIISSSAVIMAWWLLFMMHTAHHPHMILRLWAWPIAMAILILQQLIHLKVSLSKS